MNRTTRVRLTLQNAITAAEQIGAVVVFTKEQAHIVFDAMCADDVACFTQAETSNLIMVTHNRSLATQSLAGKEKQTETTV